MAKLKSSPTGMEGLFRIDRAVIGDSRGYFERIYCDEELASLLGRRTIVQINHSYTRDQGAVRGLHFQHPPAAETKIVTCLRGKVFDVAVDLRAGSSTFLNWHGEELSENNHRSLIIPEGFAHGFQTLSQDCELLYLHTSAYDPQREDGINCLDDRIGIRWPLPIINCSKRDKDLPVTEPTFTGIDIS